jgi:hypothetical protein
VEFLQIKWLPRSVCGSLKLNHHQLYNCTTAQLHIAVRFALLQSAEVHSRVNVI